MPKYTFSWNNRSPPRGKKTSFKQSHCEHQSPISQGCVIGKKILLNSFLQSRDEPDISHKLYMEVWPATLFW